MILSVNTTCFSNEILAQSVFFVNRYFDKSNHAYFDKSNHACKETPSLHLIFTMISLEKNAGSVYNKSSKRREAIALANILDYLAWRGDLSFEKDAFNEVDNLILSELCFFDFGEIMSKDEILNLGTAVHLLSEKHDMNTHRLGLFFTSSFEKLLLAAAKSHRFGDTLISNPISVHQASPAMQFAATTFYLSDGTAYVAFRGTDDYILAWKESFTLGIKDEIPGQIAALAYLKQVLKTTAKPIRVGGHSKGGNLALYAALQLSSEEQERLVAVYSNDGPGFRKNVRSEEAFLNLKGRFYSMTPYVSVVGAMLEHGDDSDVIESDGKGAFQHDVFNWHVECNRLVRVPDRSKTSKEFEATLKAWINKLPDCEKEVFLETMYKLLTSSGAKTLSELNNDKLRASYKFASTLLTLDKNTRELVLRCLALLFRERQNVLKERKQQTKDGKKTSSTEEAEANELFDAVNEAFGTATPSDPPPKSKKPPSKRK